MLFPSLAQHSPAPRVVITGAGIFTALGLGWKPNAEGFRRGKTAFRPVSLFDVSGQRVKTAAEVELPAGLPQPCVCGPGAPASLPASSQKGKHAGGDAGAPRKAEIRLSHHHAGRLD